MQNKPPVMSEESLSRPLYHFTPKAHWMNDPNGMFFYNDTYHLYFQYYPEGNVWGPMHWGHATSKDLVHWEEKPIALYPDEMGYIFSGSAVVDFENTSGFGKEGKPPIIALFTHHDAAKAKAKAIDVETQSIAYSLDEGLTWTKYEGNPVIENPGIRDFRDPKVFWDKQNAQWVMVLAAQDRIRMYRSANLKQWEYLSEFGEKIGHHGGVWECPDLFPLKVNGGEETKWVLLVSINPGGPNGGSATQYFIGDFDGKTFEMDTDFAQGLDSQNNYWVDFGRDNYAGVTWHNSERNNGNKLFIGWMSNWDYAQEVPTEKWRSAMTVARELSLEKDQDGYRLMNLPVEEINANLPEFPSQKETPLLGRHHFELPVGKETKGFLLRNAMGEEIRFGFNPKTNEYFFDRSKAGNTQFNEKFANTISVAPRLSNDSIIKATLILDKTSAELFWDNGKTVMTEIFFLQSPFDKMLPLNATHE